MAQSMPMSCVFCQLIRSGAAAWVCRDDLASAFAPLDQLAPGHTLVIPNAHHASLFETPVPVLAVVMELVQRVAHTMRTSLDAGGVDILSANGDGSEQSVPHLHFHVVPRWSDDGFSTWPAQRSRHQTSFDPVARLAAAIAADKERYN